MHELQKHLVKKFKDTSQKPINIHNIFSKAPRLEKIL